MIFTPPRNKKNIGRYVSMLEFDIAVTVTKQKEGKGKVAGKINVPSVGSFEGGIGGGIEKTDGTINRIKFKVPIALPANKIS